MTKKRIVFLDSVYTKYHLTNNLLAMLDNGKFVRTGEAYIALAKKVTPRVTGRHFLANNGIAKFFLMTCEADR